MNYDELDVLIRARIKKDPYNMGLYEKHYMLMQDWMNEDARSAVQGMKWLWGYLFEMTPVVVRDDVGLGREMMWLYKKAVLAAAKDDFDSFMLALESNRPPREQFWRPRRKLLMPDCEALQALEDDELDELFDGKPPRVGKTTLIMMFLLWVMGRNSERSNLYCSFTAIVVDTFFNGLLEVLKDSVTYDYGSIFPGTQVIGTNAKDTTLDLNRRKRYHSFTGRPIGGSLNGSCDCNGYIIGDDLCSGIEEALSKDRMASLWGKVDNNFLTRAKERCKKLWIGTRWSLVDPQGLRLDLLMNDPEYRNVRWKCINTPALNENDESNFNYAYGVGFTTDHFRKRRE